MYLGDTVEHALMVKALESRSPGCESINTVLVPHRLRPRVSPAPQVGLGLEALLQVSCLKAWQQES